AFCGFYVSKADAKLFNKASKVVLTRDGERTSITMASDYEGEPSEFALVVPVPTFITREQIRVVEMAPIDHLDAYTAPRLVEYFDNDPCSPVIAYAAAAASAPAAGGLQIQLLRGKDSATVAVEATYAVGNYDIAILRAEESDGLLAWLNENGYRMP